MKNDKQRLDWIDITKAIAIILVVMGHVVASYHEAGLYNDSIFYNFLSQFIIVFICHYLCLSPVYYWLLVKGISLKYQR